MSQVLSRTKPSSEDVEVETGEIIPSEEMETTIKEEGLVGKIQRAMWIRAGMFAFPPLGGMVFYFALLGLTNLSMTWAVIAYFNFVIIGYVIASGIKFLIGQRVQGSKWQDIYIRGPEDEWDVCLELNEDIQIGGFEGGYRFIDQLNDTYAYIVKFKSHAIPDCLLITETPFSKEFKFSKDIVPFMNMLPEAQVARLDVSLLGYCEIGPKREEEQEMIEEERYYTPVLWVISSKMQADKAREKAGTMMRNIMRRESGVPSSETVEKYVKTWGAQIGTKFYQQLQLEQQRNKELKEQMGRIKGSIAKTVKHFLEQSELVGEPVVEEVSMKEKLLGTTKRKLITALAIGGSITLGIWALIYLLW